MGVESLQMSVRGLLRQVLQELDVAGACIEEIRIAVKAQDPPHATAAAMNLYWSWARAAKAIASLELVSGGGGASEEFARDALRASRHAGARAVAELLTMVRDAAAQFEAAATSR